MARNKPATLAVAAVAVLVVAGSAVVLDGTSTGAPSADQYVSEYINAMPAARMAELVGHLNGAR